MEFCSVVRRFTSSTYIGRTDDSLEAIQFKSDRDIRVLGIGVYGGTGKSIVQVRQLKNSGDNEDTAVEVATSNEVNIDCPSRIIKRISFTEPVLVRANEWHIVSATIRGLESERGTNGKERVEADGVVFEFRNSKYSKSKTSVESGQIPEIYFEQVDLKQELMAKCEEQIAQIQNLQAENEKLRAALEDSSRQAKECQTKNTELSNDIDGLNKKFNDCSSKLDEAESEIKKLVIQIEAIGNENDALKEELRKSKFGALQSARVVMKFRNPEKVEKLYSTIQLENGTRFYFDNNKPFELLTTIGENRIDIDLSLLSGEYDCAFRGTVGNEAYFSASQEKTVKFFKVFSIDDQFKMELINELSTEDLILFEKEPVYFIEDGTQWSVYHYHENFEKSDGENFSTSGIKSLRKYKFHYHRGILYFFRSSTTARLERLNEKVVVVEGPMLDGTLSFYTPPHSDCIYIANTKQNALLSINTTNLNVSQQIYEPPIETDYHAIVGIHERTLTMLFEGKAVGRCLMTTKLN